MVEICPAFVEHIARLVARLVERQRYLYSNMKHIFFLILTALAFSFCSQPLTPKKRLLNTYVRYLADERTVHAEATYREGSPDPAPAQMPGGISFQGLPMKLRPVQGITYQAEYSSDYLLKQVFNWEDVPGKRVSFEMTMAPISKFGFKKEPISGKEPNTFTWEGGKIENGEAFALIWENLQSRETVKMEVFQNTVESEIRFPAAKLAEVQPAGRWSLYVVRKKLTKSVVDGIETSGVVEYYSKPDTIEVK